jgi:hypothetical protein
MPVNVEQKSRTLAWRLGRSSRHGKLVIESSAENILLRNYESRVHFPGYNSGSAFTRG